MRRAWFVPMLVALFVAVAVQGYAFQPGLTYGFSSDESYGGSSYLGVDTRDITTDRMAALKLKEERGVEVTMVDQDAPAGKAGIKEHDVILTINGSNVESVEELRRMIREIPPGRVITIGISRDGQPLALKAQLADRRKTFAFAGPQPGEFHFAMPAMPNLPEMDFPVSVVVVHSSMRSGLMVENLTPQLGDFFGARNGQGVLVRSVEKGSNAERAGFHAGDVITKVDSEQVADTGDFTRALRSRKSGGSVTVGIIRDRKEQTLTLTLPERRSGDLLQEESFDNLDMDAATRDSLRAAQAQMAQIQPQLALAAKEARRAADQVRKQFCEQQKQQREMRQQQEQMKQQLRKQINEQQQEMQDEMREQIERELPEIRGGTAEI